jgi:23S rRNA (pseudouridine1915-N3)-methyltransferase
MPSFDEAAPGRVMHVKFIWVGKTRSSPIRALIEDYLGRLRHLTSCEILETRDISRGRSLNGAKQLAAEAAEIDRRLTEGSRIVVLDEGGMQFASPEFARWLEGEQVRGTRELAFVVGGPDGVSAEMRLRADLRLSLGKMTWTHEMCRALLLEQVYRACSILRRIPYHK